MKRLFKNLAEILAYSATFFFSCKVLLNGDLNKAAVLAFLLGFFAGLLNEIRRSIRGEE